MISSGSILAIEGSGVSSSGRLELLAELMDSPHLHLPGMV
jgi:hypothetical protein